MATPFSRTLRAAERDTEPGYLIAVGGSILTLCAATVWLFFGSADVYVSSVRATFDAVGYAQPLTPQVSGMIVEVHANLGMRVAAGDVLLLLDSQPQQRQLDEERAQLDKSTKLVAALGMQIEVQTRARGAAAAALNATTAAGRARVEVAKTTSSYSARRRDILKKLHDKDLLAGLDSLQGEADQSISAAQARAQTSEAVAASRTGSASLFDRDAQIAALRHDFAAAQGDVAASEARIAELDYEIERRRIRAQSAGVIADLEAVALGSTVTAGQTLGAIVPAEPVRIVAHFDPSDSIGRVRVGQPAVIRVDQYPWTQYGTLTGTVAGVGSEPNDKLVRVDLTLGDANGATTNTRIPVLHGLSGTAEIRVDRQRPYQILLRLAGQMAAPTS